MARGDHRAGYNHIASFTDGDINIASTFFGGVYHYQGELILIVHTSGSKNSFLSGFAVIYTDPYLSLEILYLWHVSMNPRELCHRTDRNAKLSTVYGELRKSWGLGPL